MNNTKTYSASEARKNLYSLIKSASKGLKAIEINLRGSEPVVIVSKAELESWLETLDILSNTEEARIVRKAGNEKKLVSHDKLLKEIGLK